MHRLMGFSIFRTTSFYCGCKNRRCYLNFYENGSCFYHGMPEKEMQYLQHSIVPTMHFQDSLPRLPIPKLQKTCERYIKALNPLCTSEQLRNTLKIVEQFKSEEGKELQKELISLNAKNKNTSYISAPWFDMYLKSRKPLVLNYNPFMAFKDDPKIEYNTQLLRSTNMIISSLRFYKSLQEHLLEPEVFHLNPEKSDTAFFRKTMRLIPSIFSWYAAYAFKAFPLDMSQFNNLFNSTRIPHLGKDEIQTFSDARHILVLRNGHFYVFDVMDGNGNILPPSHIHNHINFILSDSQTVPSYSLSVLTTEDRDIWAKAREHLVQLGNAEQLQLIDSAIMVIALDEETLNDDLLKSAHHMLYGPTHNRWFDKSFTLIITKDGKAAVNFEHAWGDGVAVLRYFNEIYNDSVKNHFVGPKTVPANVDASHCVKKLDFVFDQEIQSLIKKAEMNLKQQTDRLQFNVVQHDLLNREHIKNFKLSPDSIAQLGFQMAYYKMFGKFAATYESCSTSAFKHGRTETVRPLTTATKKFVEEFHKQNHVTHNEMKEMLSNCSKVHNKLTKEAAMGQGFDRHLFGLRYMAERMNFKTPALYEDESFIQANHFILSTSTLYGTCFSGGGFGPVVNDGFGIAYGFLENQLGCLVSSFKDGFDFRNALHKSFDEIYDILSKR